MPLENCELTIIGDGGCSGLAGCPSLPRSAGVVPQQSWVLARLFHAGVSDIDVRANELAARRVQSIGLFSPRRENVSQDSLAGFSQLHERRRRSQCHSSKP